MNDTAPSGDGSLKEPYVVEESVVLLDFPEFQATSLFDEAEFTQQSLDESAVTYNIDNCAINTIRLEGINTDSPSCVLQGQLPLQGRRVTTGVTYFCFDVTDKDTSQGYSSGNPYTRQYWHTTEHIEFTSKL
ncbi:hypothetical protein BBOV_III005460 [Babesia bovis T2Bo]|uniref:Uncharacterized protein n=1 Tax=Babesia bovis TaxID=5865 RepID=A7ANH5_BABBO|nr:hypothetical protein BBOV_III005460 [Babesia bovis T2Bo]EDO08109.1 hypothetical protein BBOV_III005460 [Babesia bovis T2Bo]|eukprot:XP_001611677.1 hypothetical protein [Babesia bovis T2Bo]